MYKKCAVLEFFHLVFLLWRDAIKIWVRLLFRPMFKDALEACGRCFTAFIWPLCPAFVGSVLYLVCCYPPPQQAICTTTPAQLIGHFTLSAQVFHATGHTVFGSPPLNSRHLLRNAGRLFEVTMLGGVETLTFTGCHDDESLASSTSSGIMVPDVEEGFGFGSIRSPRRSVDNGNQTGSNVHATLLPDQTRLECRIRRLEIGRRRAKSMRRASAALKLRNKAQEYRKVHLTCNADDLASAASSFKVLVNGGLGMKPAAGVSREHVVAFRGEIEQEPSRIAEQRRVMPPADDQRVELATDNRRAKSATGNLAETKYPPGNHSTTRKEK